MPYIKDNKTISNKIQIKNKTNCTVSVKDDLLH